MKIIEVANVESAPNPHGVDARKIYDTDNALTVHMTIKPGQSLKKHMTPVDVFFYVLEGEGIVEIGDEKEKVKKDTIIDSPAKVPHTWYNESDKNLRILVVKVPKPKESTRLL
ncbi:cupin domain-containing protein [Methanobrevibacter olleyae]|uniref:Cupin 2 domain-containing protein n=1 Tax=Methanobrevibacter olleyae TaxID=294671 RepID=A0A126QWW4_METOL|nr:cupin domain-containing protein [Methanobrevibacter olleyae]AMK14620.1 cupin 2 domain-containing protein [Methanobrevibacter olleyae]SFL26850.1 Mannose-6-phosphate isomerase, cupin superfamily [Methanobrevibacter olleyae]